VHVATRDDIVHVAAAVPAAAARFLDQFAPGPLTVVLPRGAAVGDRVAAGLPTVAVRVPDHAQARALIRATGTPLVAPSANRSGRPSPTTWQAVQEDLDGRIDAILCGQPTSIGLESTVVDCTAAAPMMLRAGAISLEQLQRICPATRPYEPPEPQSPGGKTDPAAASPGMRHRHYCPDAAVQLVDTVPARDLRGATMYLGLEPPPCQATAPTIVHHFGDVDAYARGLFAAFREADRAGIRTIYCQRVPPAGIGRALMDRLERAASGR